MKRLAYVTILILSVGLFLTCQEFEVKPVTKVETGTATPLATSIDLNAKIIELSGEGNTDHGFCYATHDNPTVNDGKLSKGIPNVGYFTGVIDGLTVNTRYYVRAYCNSQKGVVYGKSVSVKTLDGQPTITTAEITNLTSTSAVSGGSITSDGGAPITARGVVWSTSQNPTVETNLGATTDGTGTGTFTSNLTDLQPGTVYYVRAYATNSVGTKYGNQLSFTSPLPDGPGGTITDIEGNIYNTIWINGRLWMKENLKTTKYSDGTSIPMQSDNGIWSSLNSPAYCWYNNDRVNYGDIFGALYNWYAVNTGKLCPSGWHVSSDDEWIDLTNYVGGVSIAGARLKAISGWFYSGNGTDDFGFSALPGGYRYFNGSFLEFGTYGAWWCSDEYDAINAWCRTIYYGYGDINRYTNYKKYGFSVRCIKD